MARRLPKPIVWSELGRLIALFAAGTWLLHPFMTGRLVGTGDALWYANMLADFVTQWRAGIFPVFVGQTEFAFNGAVYPLRVAPLYQHLAGAIDLVTGRQLDFYSLQHATVLICGFTGFFGCYLGAAKLLPEHRWFACAFAILYLSCPGALGTIYTQDLYMTWMTVPFLPWAAYGIIRTFHHDDLRSQFWLAVPLAALWFAHSPVALWMSLVAAGTQAGRLLFVHRSRTAWRRTGVGAAIFLLLAHYPFVSVATLNVPGATSAVTSGLAEQERITNVIREVFPAILKPVSEAAGALSDLQLGYALWAMLLAVIAAAVSRRSGVSELRAVGVACLLLLLLLFPVPGLTDWLWAHLPEQIKRITFYWPMHRFYLLLAALLVMAGTVAFRTLLDRWPRLQPILAVGLLLSCSWSLWETRQFVRAGKIRTATAEATARSQRPENLLLMNHAYGLFPAMPAYFSNGVMDPRSEVRLLAGMDGPPLPSASSLPSPPEWFRGSVDANPGVLKLSPVLQLKPGRRYALDLIFPDREIHGVLQLAGDTFFRQYVLPESGQPLAFGSKPGNAHTLPLWTTNAAPEEVTLRFIPTAPGAKPMDFHRFAQFRLRKVDLVPGENAVEISSLLPLQVTTQAPEGGAWVETPRMFLPGYQAEVGGQLVEVRRSAQGLAMFPVPTGHSAAVLSYHAPLPLRLSYWLALLAWSTLTIVIVRRRPDRLSPN